MSETSHVYGCTAKGCGEVATHKAERWKPGFGWVFDGDYCPAHANEADVRLSAVGR